MPIITISKEFGSGGQYIAMKVAKILDIDYFDRQIVKAVASKTHVSELEVELYEEDKYNNMLVFFSRVIDPIIIREDLKNSFPLLPEEPEPKEKARKRFVPYTCEVSGLLDSDIYHEMVKTFIEELASQKKDAVISGRGGQCILKDRKNCLHVRIVAPLDNRIERAIKVKKVDPAKAKKIVEEIDKKRRAYIKHYYNEDCRDPKLYHLIFNTSRVGLDRCAEWIAELARKM